MNHIEDVPHIPLSVNELHVIHNAIPGYLGYISHNSVLSKNNQDRSILLQNIDKRIVNLITLDRDGSHEFITASESTLLIEAVDYFNLFITSKVPESADRNTVLVGLQEIQRKLAVLKETFNQ